MYSDRVKSSKDKLDISLLDILKFVRQFYLIFFTTATLGVTLSSAYLILVPKQYQAEAKIKILRIPDSKSNVGKRVEDVGDVALWLFNEPKFDDNVLNSCAVGDGFQDHDLIKSIKVAPLKESADYFKLIITRESPSTARKCADSIGNLILKNQQILFDYEVDEIRMKLKAIKLRLPEDLTLLSGLNPKNAVTVQTYFALQNQSRMLEDQKDALEKMLNNAPGLNSLKFSINAPETPIYPKRLLIIIFGIVGGLFAGFLISFGTKYSLNFKSFFKNLMSKNA